MNTASNRMASSHGTWSERNITKHVLSGVAAVVFVIVWGGLLIWIFGIPG